MSEQKILCEWDKNAITASVNNVITWRFIYMNSLHLLLHIVHGKCQKMKKKGKKKRTSEFVKGKGTKVDLLIFSAQVKRKNRGRPFYQKLLHLFHKGECRRGIKRNKNLIFGIFQDFFQYNSHCHSTLCKTKEEDEILHFSHLLIPHFQIMMK